MYMNAVKLQVDVSKYTINNDNTWKQNLIFCSNASHIRCAKTKVVTVCVEVSSVASNINDIFLTGKISLEGQMVPPWRT